MSILSPLDFVKTATPPWFDRDSSHECELQGVACLDVPGGSGSIGVALTVRVADSQITVCETVRGTVYPAICHERHVQSDGNFCIGYQAGVRIETLDAAKVWWGLLKEFLFLQRVAERTKQWPPTKQLSHSFAGAHHLAALDAARGLGIESDYFEMLEGQDKWFAQPSPKLDDKRKRLRNGHLPCPRGCMRDGRRIARSECCDPQGVYELLYNERKRRQEVDHFYSICRLIGEKCCGRMLHCGLEPTRNSSSPSIRD
ncbi:E2 domain-containing protein [Rhizobium leguminosarum]|uniref:E2 domain-containing protein n=1 Tax=Rhizobium leguminosarum TaxID=384 RepID=UPI003D7C2562